MSITTIGILGGYGRVGLETCRNCLAIPDCRILVGGRDAAKLAAGVDSLGPNAAGMQVDIADESALQAFCGQCDLLINTAGPAAKIGDRAARAALKRGIDYIDASGTEGLHADMSQHLAELYAKNRTFIIAAGIFPGLSGVFPAHIVDTHFDDVELLEICFASEGDTLSFNAAYDVVSSLHDGYAHGMCQYEKGRVTARGVTPRRLELPDPIGSVHAYPSLSQELILLAKDRNITVAKAYLAILDNALGAMFRIRSERLFETEDQRVQAARMLMDATEQDLHNRRRCTMYHLSVQGTTSGEAVEVTSTLEFHADDATLTGITVAETARLLLAGACRKSGRFYLWEALPPTRLMEALGAHGIVPRTESTRKEPYETGVI